MDNHRIVTAELSLDDIMGATESALRYARAQFGEHINANSLDLRLWAAAALIESAIQVSVKAAIMRSLDEKLAIITTATERS